MNDFINCRSLQLFAEEAAAPESGVTEADAQPQSEPPAGDPGEFEKLIKGPYKQAYDARVKSILQQRLKSSRETAEKYAAAQPVLELMRQRLGIEGEDYGAMEQALRERLPEAPPAGQQRQEAEIQAGADRMVEAWQQRSREIQETYPEFDLEREMLRADFRQLLRARVDMQTAGTENAGYVRITLRDGGVPFNPLEKEDPDISLSAEERQIGGLGILMVKKIMDTVTYEYKDGQNVVTMEKRWQA